MKVSVVTCTWNSAATLGDTLASVKAQSYPDIEHLFVDGGSTDGTLEMIENQCPGATVLRDVRGGISLAMNLGAEAATGSILSHLHSDDYYYDSSTVADAVQGLESNPDLQWLFGQVAVLRDGQLHLPASTPRRYTYSRFCRGSPSIPHPGVFMRKSVFEAMGGFNPELKYAMDIDMWLRLGREHPPLQLNKIATVFREHAGSLSTSNVLAARREALAVHLRHTRNRPLDLAVYLIRYFRRLQRIQRGLKASKQMV